MAIAGIPLVFSAFGCALKVVFPDQAVCQALTALLPPYWAVVADRPVSRLLHIVRSASDGACEALYDLHDHDVWRCQGVPLAALCRIVASRLHDYLGEFSDEFAFVRAGVVRWRQQAIVLPGAGPAGKTMLMAALLQAGAGHVADDLALIDRDGRIRQLSPPMVPSATAASLPVAAILFLQFTPGATMTLQPLSRGEAGTRLLAQCLNAPHQPQLATACCAAAAAIAYCGEGVCGEAVQAARHILDVIDQRAGGRVS